MMLSGARLQLCRKWQVGVTPLSRLRLKRHAKTGNHFVENQQRAMTAEIATAARYRAPEAGSVMRARAP